MPIMSSISASFSLAALNGNSGFLLNGIYPGGYSGYSVSSAGDVNGDGLSDMIIGAPDANNLVGQSAVVFGSRNAWASAFNLSLLDGVNGFVVNGIHSGDESGISVSSAGDINDDGIADFIIGASLANNKVGQSYVVFGSRSAWASPFNLSLLDGTNGFVVNGIHLGDHSGFSVSSAGDVNDDGIDDLIIGAWGANNLAGQSAVVFGSRSVWTSPFNLSSLDGANGFLMNGIFPADQSGVSVSSAGDVNGDGIADLIIGANLANNYTGQSYVVFGSRNTWTSPFNLSLLDGTNGFVVNGIHPGDQSGFSVSSAGDINDDSVADLLIGAQGATPNGQLGAGQAYLVFGSKNVWPPAFNLSSLNGMNGFVLNGIHPGDNSGKSVSSAGDVNSDGINDFIIGAIDANNYAGQSYVVFGSRGLWTPVLDLSSLNGTNGFMLNGTDSGDGTGYSVSTAGDVNGDGIADLIIGIPGVYNAGQSAVVLGGGENFSVVINQLKITNGGSVIFSANNLAINPPSNTTFFADSKTIHGQFEFVDYPGIAINNFTQSQFSKGQVIFYHDGSNTAPKYAMACSNKLSAIEAQTASINFISGVINNPPIFTVDNRLSILDGSNGFVINGVYPGDFSGLSVASAGDINGDGIADLIIGAWGAISHAGQTAVVFGSQNAWAPIFNLRELDGTDGFLVNGIHTADSSGKSVASAGDVNGDGIADLIIGAPGANNKAGQSAVIFGSQSAWTRGLNLDALDGANGFVINGICPDDYSGYSVSAAGDVNGDGIADLIIGIPRANNYAGQSAVVFGSRNVWAPTLELSSLNGTNGFLLNGIHLGDQNGYSVSSAGDVNGDGIADLIIGAPYANNQIGQSAIVFGSQNARAPTFNLSSLNGTNGFLLNGIYPGGQSGYSVASAGDVNGDGVADLIIGAPYANNQVGQSAVVFGSRSTWVPFLNLSSLNGANGFLLNGIYPDDQSGYSVSSAGDINSDGISDLIIGVPYANNQLGQSAVIFGSRNAWAPVFNLSSLDGTNGFVLNGIQSGDGNGYSVASAGDINGDGISDVVIGAPYAYNQAGQSYVVFGDFPFLQLPVNQLTISNGQSLTLDSTMLSSRSFAYSRELVTFSISNLQHGHFELNGGICGVSSSEGVTVIQFTQGQIDAGEIVFVQDGSSNPPNYSVSIATSVGFIPFSVPRPANISFVTYLAIDKVTFTVNQYANQFNLTCLNILANYNLSSDPTKITFTVNDVVNGWFSNINKTIAPLSSFTQTDINERQICFYSPCGVKDNTVLPGFVLTATAPDGLTTAQTRGVILYNPAPVIQQNTITIGEQQVTLINQDNIAATDINSSAVNASSWPDPNIVFTVSVVGGRFQYVGGSSNITNFTQADINNKQVQFVSDATVAPSYNITATDTQGATSLPQAGQVTFQQLGQSSASNSNTATIAASVAIGGVAAAGLGLFLLNRRNNNRLHTYIEQASNKDNSLNKIAEVIFGKIKLTGFLNHIQKNRVTEYVNAIKEILEALTAMSFPVDLATMTEKSRNHFLEEFPRQIKGAFPISQQSRMQFFKAEITPRQIKSQANYIAQTIKHAMDMIESQIIHDESDAENTDGIPLTMLGSSSLKDKLLENNEGIQQEQSSRCYVM